MKSRFLVIDGDNLAYRAFYSRENLSYGGSPTGALFGFMSDIPILMDIHGSDTVIFCFDHGEPIRKKILKSYKSSRAKRRMEPSMAENLGILRKQIQKLKLDYLNRIGFSNVWFQDGYEADDLIAHAVIMIGDSNPVVIVSTDQDLYQLLSSNVEIWEPGKKKSYWMQDLYREYGIMPEEWATAKCIAGCSTDDIPGVPGVGNITACKFLRGKLETNSQAYQRIMANQQLIEENKKLVKLPIPGLEGFLILEDRVTGQKWRKVLAELGMKSLVGKVPVPKSHVSLF